MPIVEYLWDCTSCSRQRIKGRYLRCPTCGAPVPSRDCYYEPPPGTPEVTDVDQLRDAHAGSNWRCLHCDAFVRRAGDICESCGGGQRPAKDDWTGDTAADPYRLKRDAMQRQRAEREAADRAWQDDQDRHERRVVGIKVALGLGFLLLGISGGIWAFTTHEEPGTVVQKDWVRSVTIESWGMRTDTGWRGDLHLRPHVDPVNGRGESAGVEDIRGCHEEVRSHRRVVSGHHKQCAWLELWVRPAEAGSFGNGYGSSGGGGSSGRSSSGSPPSSSESRASGGSSRTTTSPSKPATPTCYEVTDYRSEPVYDTRCTYSTWAWSDGATFTESGTQDRDPVWPETVLAATQRERRAETYTVSMRYGRARTLYGWSVTPEDYTQWEVGDPVVVSVYTIGTVQAVRRVSP